MIHVSTATEMNRTFRNADLNIQSALVVTERGAIFLFDGVSGDGHAGFLSYDDSDQAEYNSTTIMRDGTALIIVRDTDTPRRYHIDLPAEPTIFVCGRDGEGGTDMPLHEYAEQIGFNRGFDEGQASKLN